MMSNDDIGTQVARLEEQVEGLRTALGANTATVKELADKVDQIRAPKLLPMVVATVSIIGAIGGFGSMWVNLRLAPFQETQARNQKDLDRIFDDIRALHRTVETKSDKAYVDDKIAYTFHELKNRLSKTP